MSGQVEAQSQGPIVRIGHNDPGVNTIIQMGFKRLVVERSTDNGLSFEEISKPSERPALELNKVDYVFIDRKGAASYKYRTRYANEDATTLGEPSDSIDGSGAILLQILTVDQLKQRYLFGISLTNDNGEALPDEVYVHYILSAIAWFEKLLDVKIIPTTITREAHDYYRGDYNEYCIIQLDSYPAISIEKFVLEYPSGQAVVEYPIDWISLDKDHGIIRVVPRSGTLSQVMIGQGGSFLPSIYSGVPHLPDLFKIDYTAGFEVIPQDILDIIGMMASLGPFNIFGDQIIGAGISSLSTSMDGLSQSIGTTLSAMYGGYGSRITAYTKQIKEQVPNLRRYYKGIRMVSM